MRPARRYVIVKDDDRASKWFVSEADLLRLNPHFGTLAFRKSGKILRRFREERSWNDIYPPERLRIA